MRGRQPGVIGTLIAHERAGGVRLCVREFYVFIQNGQYFVLLAGRYCQYDSFDPRATERVHGFLVRISVYYESDGYVSGGAARVFGLSAELLHSIRHCFGIESCGKPAVAELDDTVECRGSGPAHEYRGMRFLNRFRIRPYLIEIDEFPVIFSLVFRPYLLH